MQNKELIHLVNNLDFHLKKNSTLNFYDDNSKHENIQINIESNKDLEHKICITIINFNNFQKKIILNIYLENNATFDVQCNCLGLNSSKTQIEVNAISNKYCEGVINIKINGINDGNKSIVIGVPKFLFKHNGIDAKHALSIGTINLNEINYLMSRGISYQKSKFLLSKIKILSIFNVLKDSDRIKHEETILKLWKENNND